MVQIGTVESVWLLVVTSLEGMHAAQRNVHVFFLVVAG